MAIINYEKEREFERKRNLILRELDVKKMLELGKEYDLYPDGVLFDEEVVLIAMHKLRVNLLGEFTEEERGISIKFLTSRGFSTEIDDNNENYTDSHII